MADWIVVLLVSLSLSLAGVALMLWLAPLLGLIDQPNARSLHLKPTPRGGGLGVMAGIVAGWLVAALAGHALPQAGWIVAGLGLLALVSLLDDRYGLAPGWRFASHLVASVLVVLGGLGLTVLVLPGLAVGLPVSVGVVLTVLGVGWCINLFNFMDGMDGLAAGMAVIGFAALAALGVLAGHTDFALAALAVSAAGAGFLVFNFPPARIFLGDVGSVPLGFLMAVFVLWLQADDIAPLWLGLLAFAPFVLDATVTLLRRLWRREAFWQAHRSHYYQRAALAMDSHRRVLLISYGLMAGCALSAVLIYQAPAAVQWPALVGWALVFAFCAWRIDRVCP